MVEGGADAERESCGCWGHAEGDKISQGVKFLPHHAALFPPPRHLAVHEVEKEAEGEKSKGEIGRAVGGGRVVGDGGSVLQAVVHRGEYGGDATEAVQLRDKIGKMHRAHEGEVAGICGQEDLLLVRGRWAAAGLIGAIFRGGGDRGVGSPLGHDESFCCRLWFLDLLIVFVFSAPFVGISEEKKCLLFDRKAMAGKKK